MVATPFTNTFVVPLTPDDNSTTTRKPVQKPVLFAAESMRVYTPPGALILEACSGTAYYARAGYCESRNVLSLDKYLEPVVEANKRLAKMREEDECAAREGGIAMDMPSEEPPPASGRHGVADYGNEVLSGWEED
mmetsp:Transcript_4392/g.7478  ORF Transcript_4392/g.7478 Transcript_4392/m.7478 type:complete len:135 (+) Transcript_4392:422-826(+)